MTGENEMKKLSAALAAGGPCAAGGRRHGGRGGAQLGAHVLPNRLAEKQNALRQNALQQQLNGAISAGASVAKVGESAKGKGQYVKLQQTGSSKIFVILAEFGDQAPFGGAAGPLHNAMTPPNRAVDNTTIWYDAAGGYTLRSTRASTSTTTRRRTRSPTTTSASRTVASRSTAASPTGRR